MAKGLTIKQKQAVRKMYNTLHQIANDYMTPRELQKESEKAFGLDSKEALEMSYENMQNAAKQAIKGLTNNGLNKMLE